MCVKIWLHLEHVIKRISNSVAQCDPLLSGLTHFAKGNFKYISLYF